MAGFSQEERPWAAVSGRWLPLVLALLASPSLQAHDFWVEPSRFVLDRLEPVAVTLRVGERFSGESVPYIDDWIDRFEIHDGEGGRAIHGQVGDDPAGVVAPRTPGASWIAYQSNDDFVELPPDKFADYLEMEGMEYILPLRLKRGQAHLPAREYYVRCVKGLLWLPGTGGVEVQEPLGLTLEIVPRRNPYTLAPGETLELKLLYQGRPAPGLLVRAFTRDQPGNQQSQRTDGDGVARIELDRPGDWVVKAVHMVAVEGDPYGEWRSYWASLTFAQ
jgi:uncharacterized GH25 family protein